MKKMLKITSKSILLLMVVIGFVSHTVMAEAPTQAYARNTQLTLNANDITIQQALKKIQEQSEFDFFYKNLDLERIQEKVSVHFNGQTIHKVMPELLEGTGLGYKVMAKDIVIFPLDLQLDNKENIVVQQEEITGTVTDAETGEPLPGVNIVIQGTTKGTTTDMEGNYTIDAPADATLVFSFVGYKKKVVEVSGRVKIDVALEKSMTQLEEVVAIGYGTVQKKDLTGAVSVVKTDDIQDESALTIGNALKGTAAGVRVRSSGAIGSEPDIKIRGIGNFTDNQPLYVIDGVPTRANRDFNMNNVESIQVLKDASAAAIYGSRAANGVIIITTRKGQEGPMKVTLTSKMGIEDLPKMDLMGREQWIKYNNMAYDEAIENNVPGVTSRQNHFEANTDWEDEAFRQAVTQDHNLTFSGGSETGNYLVSMNYLTNSGTAYGSKMERYNFRVNTESTRGIFTIGENLEISNFHVDEMNSIFISKHTDVARMLPTIPVYDEDNPGGYGYGDEDRARTFGSNPIAAEDLFIHSNENTRIRGNIFSELEILEGLTYKLNVGIETSNDNYKGLRKVGNWTLNQPYEPSRRDENKARFWNTLVENTLSFDQEFGKHAFDGVLGTTYEKERYEQIWGEKRNLTTIGDRYFSVLDAGTTDPKVGGFVNEAALISYIGRLNYNYDDKYLLSFTFRRDGTSRLSKENRWGNFPSASAAWRINRESFFNVDWISDLKLRANYGTLGSSNIGYWDYVATLNTFPQAVFGNDQHIENGIIQTKLVNRDLKWEKSIQQNYGVDIGFLDNKLQVTAEYFINETQDVLTPLPILMTTGNSGGDPYGNAASLKNTGFEMSATWRESRNDFNYSVSLNAAHIQNEVMDFGYGRFEQYTWMTKTEIGEPLAQFFLIETDGLFQSEQEVQDHTNSEGVVIQPDAQPGDIRYVDANDDGKISTEGDRQIVGNPWPKMEMGLNFNASYKGFDFNLDGYGLFGVDVYNGMRSMLDRFDDNTNYRQDIDPWTPENTDTDFPRVIYADSRNSRGDQDRWLEDGSFFRIRAITLGYTFDKSLFNNAFDKIRLSLTAQNMITFTSYTGLDPDFAAPTIWRKGHDEMAYPNPKTLTLNVNVQF